MWELFKGSGYFAVDDISPLESMLPLSIFDFSISIMCKPCDLKILSPMHTLLTFTYPVYTASVEAILSYKELTKAKHQDCGVVTSTLSIAHVIEWL